MKTASKFCGFASLLLGVLVLIGWYTHSLTLIQVHPSFVAMQYNTALGFLICGTGLIAINLLRLGAVRFSGIFLMLLGGLTLIQYIFGPDLGIDQLLMEFYVDVKASHPGRMAPNTALCFFLVGLALLISIQLQKDKTQANVLGLLGGLILTLGSVAFFGYLSGVETAYGWGNLTRMAVHTSFGFIILGVGVIFYAWEIAVGKSNDIPKWFPILVGIASITTTFLVCQAEVSDQRGHIKKQIELISNHSKQKLQDELSGNINGLERLAKRFDVRDRPSKGELISDANVYLADHESIHLIAFVDDEFHAQWVAPLKGNEKYLGVELPQVLAHRDDLLKAKVSKANICFTVEMGEGKHGILAMIPTFRNNTFQGFVVGVIGFEQLFEEMLEGPYIKGISGLLFEGTDTKREKVIENWKKSPWLVRNSFDVSGKTWELWLKPDQSWLDAQSSTLPDVILIVGAFISLFMMMFVHLMIKARYYAKETATMNLALKKAHDGLEVRIEERTKDLRSSEEMTRAVIEGALDGMIIIDEKGNIKSFNPSAGRIFGYSQEEVLEKNIKILMPEPYHTEHDGYISSYLTTRIEKIIGMAREVKGLRKNAAEFPMELCVAPIWIKDTLHFSGIIRDITERKQTEEALKEREDQFRTLVNNIPGVSYRCLIDENWTMLYISDAIKSISGYPPSDFIHNKVRAFNSINHPDDRGKVDRAVEESINSKKPFEIEYRILHSDGRILWVAEKGQVRFDKNGEVAFLDGAIFDITDQKMAEEELRKINQQSDTALDLTKAGYWQIPLESDPNFYISSEKAVAIFGDPPRPGHRYHLMDEWFANVKAGDEEAAKLTMENFEGALEGRYPLYDATYAYKRPIDGQTVWIHALAYVSRDENGKPINMYGVTQDITESKLLESQLRDASVTAEQANKAKSIFISSMSHEIRTPMNAILGYSQILGRDKELNEKQKKGVESIHRAGKHLLDIINDILDFSKIEAGKMELHPHDFDLGSMAQDLVVIFAGKCKEKKLELRTEGVNEGQKIHVHAEASKLRQILVNLMGNAVKFTESGIITLRVMPLAGDQFYFEVKDTGQGIPSEKLESIFESFQQDEEGVKKGGTGLGLVIAKQIVSAMGGELEVESEIGKGSKFFFSISLPTAKAEVKDKDDRLTRAIGLAQGHSVSTVLIDDNRDNIDVLAATLLELGVEVTEAESGLEGLEKIRETKPDIIFVDYHMPGMDGLEVTKRVLDEYGKDTIKIVMISASTFDHHREQYMKEGIHGFVGKPFVREEILGIMARLLNLKYEFDEEVVPEEIPVAGDIDFSKIKLPKELHTSIKEMASMGMMEELEESLPKIKEIGADGRNLAACLQGMVEQFDMDGIIKALDEVESE
jgi:PAS domain S-box-containing protein